MHPDARPTGPAPTHKPDGKGWIIAVAALGAVAALVAVAMVVVVALYATGHVVPGAPVPDPHIGPPETVAVRAYGPGAEHVSALRYYPERTQLSAPPPTGTSGRPRSNILIEYAPGPGWAIDEIRAPDIGERHNGHAWLGWYDDDTPIVAMPRARRLSVGPVSRQGHLTTDDGMDIRAACVLAPENAGGADLWLYRLERPQGPLFSDAEYAALIRRASRSTLSSEQVPTLIEVIDRQGADDAATLDLLEKIAGDGLQVMELEHDYALWGRTPGMPNSGAASPLVPSSIDGAERLRAAHLAYLRSGGVRDQGLVDLWEAGYARDKVAAALGLTPLPERLYGIVRKDLAELLASDPHMLWIGGRLGAWAVAIRTLAIYDYARAVELAAMMLSHDNVHYQARESVYDMLAQRINWDNSGRLPASHFKELMRGIEPQWMQAGVTAALFTHPSGSLSRRDLPWRQGQEQIAAGQPHWALQIMIDALEQAEWPSPAAKTDAGVQTVLSAARFYSGTGRDREVFAWPGGMGERMLVHIDLNALSENGFTWLALEAGQRPRPELLAWFREHFSVAEIRARLHPNVLNRLQGSALLEPEG